MEQRVSLITLGVRDPARAAAFYEALGWQRAQSPDGVIAFDLLSQTIGLYPLEKLAEDLGLPVEALGTGAMTLSHNVRTAAEVAPLMARAEAAGAEILRPAGPIFWGGTIGYFRAPDGHIWEIAHNPFSPLAPDGRFRWEGY
ncbi:VOC family protein [Tritonibacter horizontis]|uniref:Glyoxalase-like domain protein n=1 Tax=Tritonibacter horizontis TaxID=1768241 RepID=A0A132BT96_9RHOB|nr:VOC family protein [Tritonibacter horizontis]KUP91252.1 glyoxalase-like domain protein [Tritonibacter horizontis]